MSLRTGHILQLRVDSSIVDGIVSLIFDVLLLSVCSSLSQAICSHCNLYTIYDAQQPLLLHTSNVLHFGHGLVGPVRISRLLCLILSISTISVIILGFSVKGRSDNILSAHVYHSVLGIDSPPRVARFDYENEYEVWNKQATLRPHFISRRLTAFYLMDRCQVCSYSHCSYMGIGFKDENLNGYLELFNENVVKWTFSDSVKCITNKEFSPNIVSWKYKIEKSHTDVKCNLKVIKVPSEGSFIKGEAIGDCDLTLQDIRCYRRPYRQGPKIKVHCAAVGKADGVDRKQLVLFPDANHTESVQVTPFAMSFHNTFSSNQIEHYLNNVAFLSSLDLGHAYKLDLMAFSTVIYNKTLQTRNEEVVNVTEIDLRIAIPCLVILSVTVVMLGATFMTTWFSIVHTRERQNVNSFSTVSGILELLLPDNEVFETSRSNKLWSPSIGILKGSLRLGVRRSATDFIVPEHERIEEWSFAGSRE